MWTNDGAYVYDNVTAAVSNNSIPRPAKSGGLEDIGQ